MNSPSPNHGKDPSKKKKRSHRDLDRPTATGTEVEEQVDGAVNDHPAADGDQNSQCGLMDVGTKAPQVGDKRDVRGKRRASYCQSDDDLNVRHYHGLENTFFPPRERAMRHVWGLETHETKRVIKGAERWYTLRTIGTHRGQVASGRTLSVQKAAAAIQSLGGPDDGLLQSNKFDSAEWLGEVFLRFSNELELFLKDKLRQSRGIFLNHGEFFLLSQIDQDVTT